MLDDLISESRACTAYYFINSSSVTPCALIEGQWEADGPQHSCTDCCCWNPLQGDFWSDAQSHIHASLQLVLKKNNKIYCILSNTWWRGLSCPLIVLRNFYSTQVTRWNHKNKNTYNDINKWRWTSTSGNHVTYRSIMCTTLSFTTRKKLLTLVITNNFRYYSFCIDFVKLTLLSRKRQVSSLLY